ncbi:MAG: leucine-rich repeat domain-containing protein [Bacteroidales bacterium]|nr:leucine-rich repeat domain-containing protein [Bacteroidales bacterium]MCF8458594.1 leucine-rich repeat domain-containing protein [Bacteroidales bacterium]
MRGCALVILFFLLMVPHFGMSQIQRKTFQGFLVGMNVGLNSSQMKIDSFVVYPALLPDFGLNVEKPVTKNFSFRFATGYARRGSNSSDGLFEYRNDYFDMQLQARIRAGNYVKFHLGFQRSGMIGSYVKVYSSYYFTDYRWDKTTGFTDQYEWQVGISVAIVKAMDLEIQYRLPAASHDYSTFQFSVNIYISELKRNRNLNKFTSMSEAKADPFAVEKLVLHRQEIEIIPSEVFSFTNLEELVLDGNKISVLPPEIGNLTNLKILSLQYNQLKALPPEIGKLTNLEELRLQRNQLDSLPKEIGNLSSLRFLYIGKNNLKELPEQLGLLENLIELDVAQSGVMLTIPGSLQNLQRLEKLYIDKTTILPYNIVGFNRRLQIISK